MERNPSYRKGARKPVERVTWHDAIAFCRELEKRTGMPYRLPTEAEWEYSCRAGTRTVYEHGDATGRLRYFGWYSENSYGKTDDVGWKSPNSFGLYDMHGNVWEWCSSKYAPYPYNAGDGREDLSGAHVRVIRGGDACTYAVHCRSANRCSFYSGESKHLIGFRVALSPE